LRKKIIPTAAELSPLQKRAVTFITGLITSSPFALDKKERQGQHHINLFTVEVSHKRPDSDLSWTFLCAFSK
jgi:hypothetical protein